GYHEKRRVRGCRRREHHDGSMQVPISSNPIGASPGSNSGTHTDPGTALHCAPSSSPTAVQQLSPSHSGSDEPGTHTPPGAQSFTNWQGSPKGMSRGDCTHTKSPSTR